MKTNTESNPGVDNRHPEEGCKRGKWLHEVIEEEPKFDICSICGKVHMHWMKAKYCCGCGAMMEEEKC